MQRACVLLAVAMASLAQLAAKCSAAAERKPNIILALADVRVCAFFLFFFPAARVSRLEIFARRRDGMAYGTRTKGQYLVLRVAVATRVACGACAAAPGSRDGGVDRPLRSAPAHCGWTNLRVRLVCACRTRAGMAWAGTSRRLAATTRTARCRRRAWTRW